MYLSFSVQRYKKRKKTARFSLVFITFARDFLKITTQHNVW